MRLVKKSIVLILVAVMMISCSRAGFKDSLNRSSSSLEIDSSDTNEQSSSAAASPVFDINVGEMNEDGVYLYYALPQAADSYAEAAAEKISEKIHTALFALKDQIARGKTLHSLMVYDALTRNDGVYYSAKYDISYLQTKETAKEIYCFGMVFDSVSGELIDLNSLIDINTLTALLLDEQSSKILTKDEQLHAKQRAYLSEQGAEVLKKRLSYPNGVVSLERLLDASFYLDGSKIVAVFSAPQDIGGAIKVSITLK